MHFNARCSPRQVLGDAGSGNSCQRLGFQLVSGFMFGLILLPLGMVNLDDIMALALTIQLQH